MQCWLEKQTVLCSATADDSLLLQSRDLGLTGSRMLLSLAQLLLTCLYFFRQSLHKAGHDSDRTTASFFFSDEAASVMRSPAMFEKLLRPIARDMLTSLQFGLRYLGTCKSQIDRKLFATDM